eukprot:g31641.t1
MQHRPGKPIAYTDQKIPGSLCPDGPPLPINLTQCSLTKSPFLPLLCLLLGKSKELTPTKCYRLAHSKVQDYALKDALKLEAVAANARWGKTTIK